ncbi:MAG: hypothetical protein ACRD1V_13515 [Vicinamibacterales bacterium]
MRRLLLCLPLAGAVLLACTRPIDVQQTIHVADISGGYHDVGIVEGRNKIVPSITFRITKSLNESIHPLSLNISFKKLPLPGTAPPPSEADEEWDEFYIQTVDFQGNTSAPLTVRSKAGYTGDPPQTRDEILHNHLFQDVRADIFAKYAAGQWVKIESYQLPRRLLTD